MKITLIHRTSDSNKHKANIMLLPRWCRHQRIFRKSLWNLYPQAPIMLPNFGRSCYQFQKRYPMTIIIFILIRAMISHRLKPHLTKEWNPKLSLTSSTFSCNRIRRYVALNQKATLPRFSALFLSQTGRQPGMLGRGQTSLQRALSPHTALLLHILLAGWSILKHIR